MDKLNLSFRNKVDIKVERANGDTFHESGYNLITNAGKDWLAGIMGDSSGNPATYIASTADTTDPAATDTTLTSEHATGGLERADASSSFTHTTGTDNYYVEHQFTVTSGPLTVAKSGLFDAAADGNMFGEYEFATPVVLETDDKITIRWTVDFGL